MFAMLACKSSTLNSSKLKSNFCCISLNFCMSNFTWRGDFVNLGPIKSSGFFFRGCYPPCELFLLANSVFLDASASAVKIS